MPSGSSADPYLDLAVPYGATIPTGRLEDIARLLDVAGAPAGTTDAYLADTRRDRTV